MSTSVQQKNSRRKHPWSDFLPFRPVYLQYLDSENVFLVFSRGFLRLKKLSSANYQLAQSHILTNWTFSASCGVIDPSHSCLLSNVSVMALDEVSQQHPAYGLSSGEFYFLFGFFTSSRSFRALAFLVRPITPRA